MLKCVPKIALILLRAIIFKVIQFSSILFNRGELYDLEEKFAHLWSEQISIPH